MQLDFLKTINYENQKLNTLIGKFTYHIISMEVPKDIDDNFEQSTFLIINYFEDKSQEKEDQYFIICLNFTIVIILQSDLKNILNLFSKKQKLDIYFLQDTKSKFNLNIPYNEKKIPNIFDFSDFNNRLYLPNEKIWNNYIAPCISGYLVMRSFLKNDNRLIDFFNKKNQFEEQKKVKDDEYIEIGHVGCSNYFKIKIIYHIQKQLLLTIKSSLGTEHLGLVKNETEFYQNLSFPLFPKFFGKSSDGYIIIEYIKGKTLDRINELCLNDDQKLEIIIKLIYTIAYLHFKNLIYTDLKPDNIIIDNDNNPVLIDFDKIKSYDNNANFGSYNFMNCYLPPDEGVYFESDIYSLGKVIYFIMSGKEPKKENIIKIEDFGQYPELYEIYYNCTNEDYRLRPNALSIIQKIFLNNDQISNKCEVFEDMILSTINDKAKLNPYQMNSLAYLLNHSIFNPVKINLSYKVSQTFYLYGYYNIKDVKEAISFFTDVIQNKLADSEIYCIIGYIYYFYDVVHDFDKAIYYLAEAEKQKNSKSMFLLGYIYYNKADIKNAIQHLSKAIKYNNKNAYYLLGLIYYNGKYVEQEIDKAIFYFEQARKKNYSNASIILGMIFKDGIYVKQDIDKAKKYHSDCTEDTDLCYIAKVVPQISSQYDQINFYKYESYVFYDYLEPINEEKCVIIAIKSLIRNAKKEEGILYLLAMIYFFQILQNNNDSSHVPDFFLIKPELFINDNMTYILNKIAEISSKNEISKEIENIVFSQPNKSPEVIKLLWLIYLFFQFDLNKGLYYLHESGKYNDVDAKFLLGLLYSLKYYRDYFKNSNLDIPEMIESTFFSFGVNYQESKKLSNYIRKIINSKEFQQLSHSKDFAIMNLKFAQCNGKPKASVILCFIYIFDGKIKEALKLAECIPYQSNMQRNYVFGMIHFFNKDIQESVKFFKKGAEENDPYSRYMLGFIYSSKSLPFMQNIQKSNQYLLNSPLYHDNNAYNFIANNYEKLNLEPDNMKKAIRYYLYASEKGNPEAQLQLGIIYLEGKHIEQDIKEAFNFFIMSSKNGNIEASFAVGYFYLVGSECCQKNIDEAIKFFKEGSSFKDRYSKNNLGIIYKFYSKETDSINYALTYLKEAFDVCLNPAIAYNLAHIYIYNENFKDIDRIQEAINILNYASFSKFDPAVDLLCIALILKFKNKVYRIKEKICCRMLRRLIIDKINHESLINDPTAFHKKIEHYRNIGFLFDFPSKKAFSTNDLDKKRIISTLKPQINENLINDSFYEGFGI